MKIVGKIAEEMEKTKRNEEEKRMEEIRKRIREKLNKKLESFMKQGKTYKVRINDMEIEVPEGFEVVVTSENIILRTNQEEIRSMIAEEILIRLEDLRETVVEGIVVATG